MLKQNTNNLIRPQAASALLVLSSLTLLLGLPISLLALAYADQVDVAVFRPLVPLLPFIMIGQLICAIYMYKGKLWGLAGVTIFVLMLLVAQIIQSSTHPTNLAVYVPFALPVLLLAILWTRNRGYFI